MESPKLNPNLPYIVLNAKKVQFEPGEYITIITSGRGKWVYVTHNKSKWINTVIGGRVVKTDHISIPKKEVERLKKEYQIVNLPHAHKLSSQRIRLTIKPVKDEK